MLGLTGAYAPGLDEPSATTEEMAGVNADRWEELRTQDDYESSGQGIALAIRFLHPTEAR